MEPARYDGVDAALADGTMALLQARGIVALTGRGRPSSWPADAAGDPLRPAAPERHLLSTYLHHSAATTCHGMLDGASARDRTRLLSAGGPTAGAAIVSELNAPGERV